MLLLATPALHTSTALWESKGLGGLRPVEWVATGFTMAEPSVTELPGPSMRTLDEKIHFPEREERFLRGRQRGLQRVPLPFHAIFKKQQVEPLVFEAAELISAPAVALM